MCISNIIIAFNFKEKKALTCAIVTLDLAKFEKKFAGTLFKKKSPGMGTNDLKWSEFF